MWGKGFVLGLGGLGLPFGSGRLPPPKAVRAESGSSDASEISADLKWKFPLKAGLTSGSLTLVGDAAAQFYSRFEKTNGINNKPMTFSSRSLLENDTFWQHDWVRALRMTSYGFLLYGPLSHFWYQFLDCQLPAKTFQNFSLKVLLNQIVLGPVIVSIVFSWNCAWQKRLTDLPDMLRDRAIPALMDGWKFWTPVSFLNFGVVPLDARVAFMSTCAICWNFYLSTVVSAK